MVTILCGWLFLTVSLAAQIGQDLPVALHGLILQREDERNLNGTELIDLLQHSSPAVRERAALALGRIGERRVTPALLEALERERVDAVRRMIVFALGELEDPQAVPILLRIAGPEKASQALKARAAEALGKIGQLPDRAAVARVLLERLPVPAEILTAEQVRLTGLVMTALLRIREPETAGPLALQLRSTSPEVRAAAANALARLRTPLTAVVPDLMNTLTDGDPEVRANATRALGVAQDMRAAVSLTSLLRDRDERVVVAAVRALGALRESHPTRPLVELGESILARTDRTGPLRLGLLSEIATILGNLKDQQALPFLKALRARVGIGGSPEVETALAAFGVEQLISIPVDRLLKEARTNQGVGNLARGLAGAGEPRSRELLLLLWAGEPPDSPARPEILRALVKVNPQTLRAILREALLGPDPYSRATAAELGPGLDAAPTLTELVEASQLSRRDRVNDARLALLRAINRHQDVAATRAIEEALNDEDHLVRRLAVELLRARGAGDQSDRIGIVRTLRPPAYYLEQARRLNQTSPLRARLVTTRGVIELELFRRDAPLTVANLVTLAGNGYFNGLGFHRVVPNFVIQGGDPRGDGEGGPGYQIRCEINTRPYLRGTLGMALSGKDTGGSQFFITHSAQPHLDGGYTVFGQVLRGHEIVDQIVRGDRITELTVIDPGATSAVSRRKAGRSRAVTPRSRQRRR